MNKYTSVLKANGEVFIHFLAVTCKSRSLLEPLRRVCARVRISECYLLRRFV